MSIRAGVMWRRECAGDGASVVSSGEEGVPGAMISVKHRAVEEEESLCCLRLVFLVAVIGFFLLVVRKRNYMENE